MHGVPAHTVLLYDRLNKGERTQQSNNLWQKKCQRSPFYARLFRCFNCVCALWVLVSHFSAMAGMFIVLTLWPHGGSGTFMESSAVCVLCKVGVRLCVCENVIVCVFACNVCTCGEVNILHIFVCHSIGKWVGASLGHPSWSNQLQWCSKCYSMNPDSKVHGANVGPIWGRQDPGDSRLAPWTLLSGMFCCV